MPEWVWLGITIIAATCALYSFLVLNTGIRQGGIWYWTDFAILACIMVATIGFVFLTAWSGMHVNNDPPEKASTCVSGPRYV